MLRLLADENLHSGIIRGLLRRDPTVDIVRVQDVGLSGADDPDLLDWAARERRVLVTHDVNTITRYWYHRVRAGQGKSGTFRCRSRKRKTRAQTEHTRQRYDRDLTGSSSPPVGVLRIRSHSRWTLASRTTLACSPASSITGQTRL